MTFRSTQRSACKHEVFLGGSCNPTTWRLELAIPALQNASITYFNPQVDEWFPELIEVEEQAKTAATLLLFVIDNQTRAISSMVEVAYLAGQHLLYYAIIHEPIEAVYRAGTRFGGTSGGHRFGWPSSDCWGDTVG